jgi:type VI secretion system secreted protein Hcp
MVDYFLDLGDIKGESIDEKHKDQIKVESFSWGGSQHTTVAGSGGSGAGKVSLSDFSIMKVMDKATPKLLTAMCAGTHIAKGTLYASKAGSKGDEYLKVEFDELFVTSLQLSASSEVPMESVSFSYNKASMTYKVQDETGQLTAGGEWTYDLKANKLAA